MEFQFHKNHIRHLLDIEDTRQMLDSAIEELSNNDADFDIPGVVKGNLNQKNLPEINDRGVEVIKSTGEPLIINKLGETAISSIIISNYRKFY